jgi:hypothetical protein
MSLSAASWARTRISGSRRAILEDGLAAPLGEVASEVEVPMQKILAIEDDRRIHKMLKLAFEPEGYSSRKG